MAMKGRDFNTEMHLCVAGDPEIQHCAADKLLVEALRRLTESLPDAAAWECGIKRFERMTKWYA